MKKIILIISLSCFCCAAFADKENISAARPDISERCRQLENDQKTLGENPGIYYFSLASCKLFLIHDESSFNEVVEIFNKSAKVASNPALAYFAIGTLYQSKYKGGELYYGIKGVPQDLIQAISNYEKAAELGSSLAQDSLGVIYLNEINLSQDLQQKQAWDVKQQDVPIPIYSTNSTISRG